MTEIGCEVYPGLIVRIPLLPSCLPLAFLLLASVSLLLASCFPLVSLLSPSCLPLVSNRLSPFCRPLGFPLAIPCFPPVSLLFSSRVSTVSSSSPPVFLLASTFPPCLPSAYLVFHSCPPLVSFLCLFCHPPVTTTPLSHDKKQGVFITKAMKARVFVVCPFFPERVAGHLATSQS